MITEFIIENGNIDERGDKLDLSGMKGFNRTMPILHNFDNNRVLGTAEVYEENGVIKGKTMDVGLDGFYPALGGKVLKSHFDEKLNARVIDEFEITEISLNITQNADPTIRPIGINK